MMPSQPKKRPSPRMAITGCPGSAGRQRQQPVLEFTGDIVEAGYNINMNRSRHRYHASTGGIGHAPV